MKGIILAGGSGSRLFPLTLGVSKQLLPVYDKPMIYYPMSVLFLAGIREILIITTPADRSSFERIFGDGRQLGVEISYAVQPEPKGLAEAFIIGESFIGDSRVCLVLGDNIYYGQGLSPRLRAAANANGDAVIFGYEVKDPQRFGVVDFDSCDRVLSIEEKPSYPKSSYAVTGLYFYDSDVVDVAKNLRPSQRGELEITDVNLEYLKQGNLKLERLGRGYAWFDAGTTKSLLTASNFIENIQSVQGFLVGCLEEIALANGWLKVEQIMDRENVLRKSDYGRAVMGFIKSGKRK